MNTIVCMCIYFRARISVYVQTFEDIKSKVNSTLSDLEFKFVTDSDELKCTGLQQRKEDLLNTTSITDLDFELLCATHSEQLLRKFRAERSREYEQVCFVFHR